MGMSCHMAWQYGAQVLAPSFITASLQQFLWCSVVERLEPLVLSVCAFPSYCLLTALMSPKDNNIS